MSQLRVLPDVTSGARVRIGKQDAWPLPVSDRVAGQGEEKDLVRAARLQGIGAVNPRTRPPTLRANRRIDDSLRNQFTYHFIS